ITTTTIKTITVSLPYQCSSYITINDSTHNVAYGGGAGTIIVKSAPSINHCGTAAPGWYSGIYPSAIGSTTTGMVCYNANNNTCKWNNSISITNCTTFYVFALFAPPTCNLRYCTT
ncbi:unnamed protein product, partial [Didymodactylos carnosus]